LEKRKCIRFFGERYLLNRSVLAVPASLNRPAIKKIKKMAAQILQRAVEKGVNKINKKAVQYKGLYFKKHLIRGPMIFLFLTGGVKITEVVTEEFIGWSTLEESGLFL
jgi:hypothetical protein